jgi:hypothetical protein
MRRGRTFACVFFKEKPDAKDKDVIEKHSTAFTKTFRSFDF